MTLVSLAFFLVVVALLVYVFRGVLGHVAWFVLGFVGLSLFLTYGWATVEWVPVEMPVVLERGLIFVDEAVRYPWIQFWALVDFIRSPSTV